MATRRTRSGDMPSQRSAPRITRMVRSSRVPSHELVKAVSQPMLVIPQPVLRIHECLDESVRMARVEPNAYVALGIKEEPIDIEYEEEIRNYDGQLVSSFNTDGSQEPLEDGYQDEIEGMRTTRSVKRKRLLGLATGSQDDANNNKKQPKKRTSRAKKTQPEASSDGFNPIVVSTYSMAPTSTGESIEPIANKEHGCLQSETPTEEPMLEKNGSENNNVDYGKHDYEPVAALHREKEPAEDDGMEDGRSDTKTLTDDAPSPGPESPDILSTLVEPNQDKDEERRTRLRVRSSKQLGSEEPTSPSEDEIEEEEDSDSFEDPKESASSSSEEEAEDTTPKKWVLSAEERSTLSCSICQKKCSSASILTAHKKRHFDSKTYNCSHCNKTFSSESSYKHHMAYSGLAPHKCDQCGKSYYTEQKAESHRAQCQGKNTEKKYHCDQCGRSYVMLCSLRTHIRERHTDFKPVKKLCCEMCGKRFRHKKYLELHMYSHSSEKKFECEICHRKYKSSDILRHHFRMAHKSLPRVECEICHKEVSRVSLKAHLNRHREKQEEEEESARQLLNMSLAKDSNAPCCPVCTKYFENEKILMMHPCEGRDGSYSCPHCTSPAFSTAAELVNHVCEGLDNSKSRNSAKIYTCVFCKREYNCHTPYLYHVRHHTSDKPYPCPECGKSFRLNQGLKVHMRNHTGEKPFKCEQCPAAFKQKPFLLDHINTHTGNKPYQCQKCLARFSVRSALSTHKRIHRREAKRIADADAEA